MSAVESPLSESLESALRYAELTWQVFSVTASKKPFAGSHGFCDASSSRADVEKLWAQYPGGWPAVRTGAESRIVIFDVDRDPAKGLDGHRELDRLIEKHGPLPKTPCFRTPRGGMQYVFAHPGIPVRCSNSKIAPGLDVKGEGGYGVLPPAPKRGWIVTPWETPPATLPAWLLGLMVASATPATNPPIKPISEGKRNTALLKIGGRLRREGFGEPAIAERLLKENAARCKPPLSEHEVRRIARSAARYPSGVGPEYGSDLANAKLFVTLHGDRVRFVHDFRKWIIWNGKRWKEDDDGEVQRLAKATVEHLYAIAASLTDDEQRRALRKRALAAEAAPRIRSLIELAASEPSVSVTSCALDLDPWILSVDNGILDLRSGKLLAADPSKLITKHVPVPFDPSAKCPRWQRFLKQVMNGNDHLIRFLQRAIGYSLTGDISAQVMFILYGTGANGKSTLLRVAADVTGDYFRSCPAETLLAKHTQGSSNDLARLKGARLIACSEGEENRKLAESLVKLFTGEDKVTARFLYGEFFEFIPEGKLWFVTNHKPGIRGTDQAIWRRLLLIPFTVTIPEKERDPKLIEKLRRELPGILAWAIRGCVSWQAKGLRPAPEVLSATASYRREEDRVVAFVSERCRTGPTFEATGGELYLAYRQWCEWSGEQPMSNTLFGRRLEELGYRKSATHKRGRVVRRGLRLTTPPVP